MRPRLSLCCLGSLVAIAVPLDAQVASPSPPFLSVQSHGEREHWMSHGWSPPYVWHRDEIVRDVTFLENGDLLVTQTITPSLTGPEPVVQRHQGWLSAAWRTELAQALEASDLPSTLECAQRGSFGPSSWDGQNSAYLDGSDRLRRFDLPGPPAAPGELACEQAKNLLYLVDTIVSTQILAASDSASPASRCDAGPKAFTIGGRFRVDVCWSTWDGASGTGTLDQQSGDGATVWFFNPSNPELFLKIKDACIAPYERYWVFLSGLTNVDVTTTVTDTMTGLFHTYRNPLGTSFAARFDTATFDVCP